MASSSKAAVSTGAQHALSPTPLAADGAARTTLPAPPGFFRALHTTPPPRTTPVRYHSRGTPPPQAHLDIACWPCTCTCRSKRATTTARRATAALFMAQCHFEDNAADVSSLRFAASTGNGCPQCWAR